MGDSESSEEELAPAPVAPLAAFAFSDDEEADSRRIVRSAKEKRYEELNNIIKDIRNFKKNKDMSRLESSFGELCRAYQKASAVIAKEEGGKTPRFYVRCLV